MIDKKLLSLLNKEVKDILFLIFLKITALFVNIWMIFTISNFIYLIVSKRFFSKNDLFKLLLILLLKTILILTNRNLSTKISNMIKEKLRLLIYDKSFSYGMKCRRNAKLSDLVTLSVDSVESLEIYFSAFIPQLFYALIAPLILACFLFSIHYVIALSLILLIPLIPLAILIVTKLAKKVNTTYWASYLDLSEIFVDFLQGFQTLLIFGADDRYNKKLNHYARKFRINTMKVLSLQLNNISALDLVAYLGSALGIILSLYYYSLSLISIKETIIVILISAEFFLPLRSLGSLFHVAMNGMGASKFLFDIVDKDIKQRGDNSISSHYFNISLKNISFSYDKDRKILKDISMDLEDNKLIYIVGKSGCGKSTIASLIMNKIDPDSGKVEYSGNAKVKEDEILKNITLVTNKSYLFNESLRENLLMGRDDISDERLWNVLDSLSLKEYFLKEEGLDTLISQSGDNLSGGQKQRLIIARALLKDSKAYIFDEATSNIDSESEDIIMKNLEKLKENKLIIIISHRLKYSKDADYIYYMKDGFIKEEGNFTSLINNDKGYKKIFDKQTSLENWRLSWKK